MLVNPAALRVLLLIFERYIDTQGRTLNLFLRGLLLYYRRLSSFVFARRFIISISFFFFWFLHVNFFSHTYLKISFFQLLHSCTEIMPPPTAYKGRTTPFSKTASPSTVSRFIQRWRARQIKYIFPALASHRAYNKCKSNKTQTPAKYTHTHTHVGKRYYALSLELTRYYYYLCFSV